MNIRTTTIRLVNNPETSAQLGWLASQQRLAYNQAVDTLNRRPHIPRRAKKGSNYGLNKTTTAWRNENTTIATAGPITSISRAARPPGTPTNSSSSTAKPDWKGSKRPKPRAKSHIHAIPDRTAAPSDTVAANTALKQSQSEPHSS